MNKSAEYLDVYLTDSRVQSISEPQGTVLGAWPSQLECEGSEASQAAPQSPSLVKVLRFKWGHVEINPEIVSLFLFPVSMRMLPTL